MPFESERQITARAVRQSSLLFHQLVELIADSTRRQSLFRTGNLKQTRYPSGTTTAPLLNASVFTLAGGTVQCWKDIGDVAT